MADKKLKRYIKWGLLLIALVAVISFLVILFGMMLFVEGKIVEDRPLWGLACRVRPLCYTWNTALSCSGPAFNIDDVFNTQENKVKIDSMIISPVTYELANWGGYHGCNESTNGFFEDNNIGKVDVSICGCKSLLN